MFATHYGHGTSSDTDKQPIVEVKILNVNKITTREDLRISLSRFDILEVKLIKCEQKKVNYAYVHLSDRATAEQLITQVHNKMTVHSNLLRAILKLDQSQSHEEILRKNLDINIVELLVHDQDTNVTEADLKGYFAEYGEIDDIRAIYEGHPRLLHLRYTNAVSAYVARYSSPHCVAKTTVTALPLPSPKEREPEETKFSTKTFPCDPVIIETVEKTLVREFHDLPDLKIQRKNSKLFAHSRDELDRLVERKIERIIRICESEIIETQMVFHNYSLPIVAEPETQKHIEEIKTPFEIKIKRGSSSVSLKTLQQDYSKLTSSTLGIFAIKRYLSSSTSDVERTNHKWYWQDDNNDYQPYTEEVNKTLENKFKKEPHVIKSIGKFIYIISFDSMKQINVSTGKSRSLKRTQTQSEEVLVLTLQLRAHQGNISYLKSFIINIISKFTAEAKIQVPDSAIHADSFQSTLNNMKKKFLQVTMNKDKNSTVSIKGKRLLVAEAEGEIHKEILKIVAEKSFQQTLPSTWEPQSNKCALKAVTRGTPEWNNIQDKMSKPDFRIQIIKIERVQNTWLWELYQLSKKRMSEKNDGDVNEKALFHGTRQTSPKDIYDSEQGFDSRLASQGLWGEGTYFAVSAKYSHSYAHTLESGHKQMFLAQAITGASCKLSSTDRTLKAPPKKEDSASISTLLHISKFEGERYDSVTGTSNGSKIYVIYELGRVYPAYLITYSY